MNVSYRLGYINVSILNTIHRSNTDILLRSYFLHTAFAFDRIIVDKRNTTFFIEGICCNNQNASTRVNIVNKNDTSISKNSYSMLAWSLTRMITGIILYV